MQDAVEGEESSLLGEGCCHPQSRSKGGTASPRNVVILQEVTDTHCHRRLHDGGKGPAHYVYGLAVLA